MPDLATKPSLSIIRQRWIIAGQVQGVGFRPFVYRLARAHSLCGFVRNDNGGLLIEVQGGPSDVNAFASELRSSRPSLATVRAITCESAAIVATERDFHILDSIGDSGAPDVTVDTATCPECLAELLSTTDRRHGYPLINCTNCGPRYSIVQRIPYDRPNTTMAPFAMCSVCRSEYDASTDRRFHAQPIACHDCGPQVSLVSNTGAAIPGDPIAAAATRLLAGEVLAIKGLGGFHLACRADISEPVALLRQRKARDFKPFAVMVACIEDARAIVQLGDHAAAAMLAPACPIVLAPKMAGAKIAADVAPGNHRFGVMLPYTPMQHLLFQRLAQLGHAGSALVMTSANLTDEPLVIDNAEALARLGHLCDAILWHDRPIERGVDDSVSIDAGTHLIPIRRSRGYAPSAFPLPVSDGSMGLCLGGELKNTIGIVRDGQAILSQHLGDLTHAQAFRNFRKTIADMRNLFSATPAWIAHDLHPVYLSTQEARRMAAELGVPAIAVQHHHAHAAAVLAEHGARGPVLAVICDGTGYGTDNTIGGGELLQADLANFTRLARLKPLALPGGDAASKNTRRSGLALLHQTFGANFAEHPAALKLVPDKSEREILARMIRDAIHVAYSSGAGRVFDGVAALLGVCTQNHFEGQAGITLEALAARAEPVNPGERVWFERTGGELQDISLRPLIREILRGVSMGISPADLSAFFHEEFARTWFEVVRDASRRTGLRTVALSGGVFCNARLSNRLAELLEISGFTVLRHRLIPPNDGGIALGQAAVAMARRSAGGASCA